MRPEDFGIKNYTREDDGSISVDGNVDLMSQELKRIPFRFMKVTGNFICRCNKLKTLMGCPRKVGGAFSCADNMLKNLVGGAKYSRKFF